MNSEAEHHGPPAVARVRSLLFTVPAVRNRVRAGVRSGAAFGIAAVIAVALGHPQEALFVTFGAFAVIFGDNRPIRIRGTYVAVAGSALILATWLGAATGHALIGRESAAAAGTVLMVAIAAVAAAVITALRLGPPGALFFVLTASAGMAAAQSGASVATIVGYAALGWGSALAVTAVSIAIDRRLGASWDKPRVPGIGYRWRRAVSPHSHAAITTARVVVACSVAGAIGVALGSLRPYWAVLAAVVILGAGPDRTRGHTKAIHRFAGTTAGLVLFAGLHALHPTGYALIALLTVLMFGIELFVVGNYALAVLCITPTALLAGAGGAPDGAAVSMMRDRFLETLIGVAVAAICLETIARRGHRRGLRWSHDRVRHVADRLETAIESGHDTRILCDALEFELTGYVNAGMDCAHNDSEWVREHWSEHAALVRRGRELTAGTAP